MFKTEIKLIFSVMIGLISLIAPYAQASVCNNETAISINRPLLKDQPELGMFQYRFGYQKRDDPEATVLIFIPGGPGQTSMDLPLALPHSFAVVRTDPRGVGCNKASFPSESFRSEEIAADIIAVIKEIKPKRYILHGISYGTVVATLVAAAAERENIPQPLAVVLEGTMGKHYKKGEYSSGYIKTWDTLLKELPRTVSSLFDGPEFPLGFTSVEWAAYVSSMLIYGETPAGKNLLNDSLLSLDPDHDGKTKSLSAQLNRIRGAPAEDRMKVHREIICRELVPDTRDLRYDFDLRQRKLVLRDLHYCAGIDASNLYNSAIHQISAPIYYFSGKLDPATPPAQASYHFTNQLRAKKMFISVIKGGHQALSFNLTGCSTPIWLAIENDRFEDLELALKQCRQASEVTTEL